MFAPEDQRLRAELEHAQVELAHQEAEERKLDDVASRFEEVAAVLADLDTESIWQCATDPERRVLIEELLAEIAIFPDHLEVEVFGAPRLNVLLEEVGLNSTSADVDAVHFVGVRGGSLAPIRG